MDETTIYAFMQDETAKMLEILNKKGINTTKCVICGEAIKSWEVPPYYLMDRIKRWFGNPKKFYEWNIDAIVHDGVVCDKGLCFYDSLYRTTRH